MSADGGVPVAAVEVVSYSFGRRLEYLHGVGPGEYGAEDGLYEVFGFLPFGVSPQAYFGEVCHGDVFGAYAVGFFG